MKKLSPKSKQRKKELFLVSIASFLCAVFCCLFAFFPFGAGDNIFLAEKIGQSIQNFDIFDNVRSVPLCALTLGQTAFFDGLTLGFAGGNNPDFDVVGLIAIVTLAVLVIIATIVMLYYSNRQMKSDIDKEHQEVQLNQKLFQTAVAMSNVLVYRYIIAEKKLVLDKDTAEKLQVKEIHENIPDSLLQEKRILSDTATEYKTFFANIHAGVPTSQCVFHFVDDQGKVRWARIRYSLIVDQSGKPVYAGISHYDITAEQESTAQLELWQAAIESYGGVTIRLHKYNITKGYSIIDKTGNDENSILILAFEEYAKRNEFILNRFVCDEDKEAYVKATLRKNLISQFLNGKTTTSLEYRVNVKGEKKWRRIDIKLFQETGSEDILSYHIVSDIDKIANERLEVQRRAEIDALTGLFNRDAFTHRANKLLYDSKENQQQHAFVYLDIDGFKRVNDTLGHQEGDAVLSRIASIMSSILHPGDIAGRMGGDEFMLILADMPYYSAIHMRLEKLRTAIARMGISEVSLSASMGIAMYPTDAVTFEELYEKADKALYVAKERGKNNIYLYHDEKTAQSKETSESHLVRILIADEIEAERKAIENMLSSQYSCLTATSVKQTMDLFSRYGGGISLLIIDAGDPHKRGYDLLKAMKSDKILFSIPIIMVVDEDDAQATVEALSMGASDCISRPINKDILTLKVEKAIVKRKSIFEQLQQGYDYLRGEEEQRYRMVLNATDTIVLEFDAVNLIFYYDSSISNYLHGNYDNRPLPQIMVDDGAITQDTYDYITKCVTKMINGNDKEIVFNIQILNKEKQERWFKVCAVRPTEQSYSNRIIFTLQDVNEEYLASEKINRMARYDELTGIYNYFGFVEAAKNLLAQNKKTKFCIANFRIVNFNTIKPVFGEEIANKVLKTAASQITKEVGNNGVYGRISADSFIICTPYEKERGEERVKKLSTKTFRTENFYIELQLHFGICLVEEKVSVELMIDRAEAATAKVSNSYLPFAYYDKKMHKVLSLEQELITGYSAALENKEFVLFYQPQIDYKTKRAVGAEALVRWNHPTRGLLSPSAFVPIFEQNGFIVSLDKYVWKMAIQQMRTWIDEGKKVMPISLNLSQVDIYNPRITSEICEIVDKYQVDRSLIRFEITESAQAETSEEVIKVIKRLGELGFVTEMDDFGCGYSSLTSLRNLPVSVLKINTRQLLPRIEKETKGEKDKREIILGSVIDMTKKLGYRLIAEGIETESEAENIYKLGCDIIQGYFFDKPLTEEEFEKKYLS